MTIEQRIERLERESLKWRRLATCLGIGLAVTILGIVSGRMAQPVVADEAKAPAVADELRAKRLTIVNDDGQKVVEILTTNGIPAMSFTRPSKDETLSITNIAGTGFGLMAGDGKMATSITSLGLAHGATERNGIRPVVSVGSSGDVPAGGAVVVFNALGKHVAALQADKSNQGTVGVAGANGDFTNFLVPKRP